MRTKKHFTAKNILMFVVIAGFILRLGGLFWGLPIEKYIHCTELSLLPCYHPDESKFYLNLLSFPSNYFQEPNFHDRYVGYGTSVQFLTGILLSPLILVSHLFNEFYFQFFLILFLRFLMILSGSLAAFATYFLGKELFNKKTGVIASVLVGFSYLHIVESGYAKPEAFMSLMLCLCYFYLVRVYKYGKLVDYLLLGLVTGLFLGTKVLSFFFIPAVILVILRKRNIRHAIIMLAVALLLYEILNPHVVFFLKEYLQTLQFEASLRPFKTISVDYLARLWQSRIDNAFRFPVSWLILLGVFVAFARKTFFSILLILYIGLYLFAVRETGDARYFVTITPLLSIFAATFVDVLWKRGMVISRYLIMFGGVFFVLLCLRSYFELLHIRRNDPRTQAAKYIEEHIPKGTVLGFSSNTSKVSWRNDIWKFPRVDPVDYSQVSLWSKPEILILSSYNIDDMGVALLSPSLSKPSYVWDKNDQSYWEGDVPLPEEFEFYDQLINCVKDCDYELLIEFTYESKYGYQVNESFIPRGIWLYKKI